MPQVKKGPPASSRVNPEFSNDIESKEVAPAISKYVMADWEAKESQRQRELEEARARAAQMEKTMKWWSDCTANWREKWSKVRNERNKARDEAKRLRNSLELAVKEAESYRTDKDDLEFQLILLKKQMTKINPIICTISDKSQKLADSEQPDCHENGPVLSAEMSHGLLKITNNPVVIQAPLKEKSFEVSEAFAQKPESETATKGLNTAPECTEENQLIQQLSREEYDEHFLLGQITMLQSRLADAEKIIHTEREEKCSLIHNNEKRMSENQEANYKCEELRLAKQEAVRELLTIQEQHRAELRILNNTLQEEVASRENFERRLCELRAELERLQAENASEWEKRERLETEKVTLERDNKKLWSELRELQGRTDHRTVRTLPQTDDEISGLQEELIERQKEIGGIKHSHLRLKKLLGEANTELAHAVRRAEQYENEVKRLRLRIEELKCELAGAQDQLDAACNQVRCLQRSHIELSGETEHLRSQMQQLQSRSTVTMALLHVDTGTTDNINEVEQEVQVVRNMTNSRISSSLIEIIEIRSSDEDPSALISDSTLPFSESSSSNIIKKRRSREATPESKRLKEDEESGSICPICLDHWEMSGDHRLASLKCGHLFGHSCIKRWLTQCSANNRCCPTCKIKALSRDLRFIYAKKICVVDNSEEHRLRELLHSETTKNCALRADIGVLNLELSTAKKQILSLETEIQKLKRLAHVGIRISDNKLSCNYKLYLEKNIEISKEPGCRVMTYGLTSKSLYVSQKSNQTLFPGFGIRYLDVETFRPTNFLHISANSVRDLALGTNEDLIITASMEKSAKLFSIVDRTVVNVFSPSDKALWACEMSKETDRLIYLGAQNGSVYTFDVRFPKNVVEELKNDGDMSPVISICEVPASARDPSGGFLVCKLQSVWFHEYLPSQQIRSSKISVEGPFVSMCYEKTTDSVLIVTRPSAKYSQSRYIVAKIIKVDSIAVLDIIVCLNGSNSQPVMTKSVQICVKDDYLIAGYLQDSKMLTMWNVRNSTRIQSIPVFETVLDTCAICTCDTLFLAALTDCKCRIYRMSS